MDNDQKIIIPPNSKDSEMMVLGCMLTSIYALNFAADSLIDFDFYYSENKIIFHVLKAAYKSDKPADIHIVLEELKRLDKINAVGGAAYITTLAQYAGTSAYIEEYVEILKNFSVRRKLIYLGDKLCEETIKQDNPYKILLEIQESIKQIEKHKNPKDLFPIRFLNQFENNFLLVKPSPKPMLLEYSNEKGIPIGFLPKSIVAMLFGAGGVGKTHFLAQLAIAVATGTPFIDTYTTTEHCGAEKMGNVFFGLGENQYDDIHRVLYKASKKLREKQPDFLKCDPLQEASKRIAPFSFCGQQAAFIEEKKPSLYFRQLKMRLEDMAPKEGWSLIILDPVSRLMGADAETDNAAATQFIALLEELIIDLPGKPTILFAHHQNKLSLHAKEKSQTAARGSSALTDGVRWQILLSKENNDEREEIKLTMTKTNFTAFAPGINLEKDREGFLQISLNKTQDKPIPKNGDRISAQYE